MPRTFAALSFVRSVIRSITLVLVQAAFVAARAQCVTTITSFPYLEDFEAGPAWTSGGTSSDWAWGTPAHPTINSAGGGVNSWCVGGLTGSFYSLGQQSWIESPCFDLSGVPYPWISFKIFWEVERQYDGLVLQYSLNAGASWQNVGAFGDPVDCLNDNWYNEDYVNNLTTANPRHGWSGRIGATVGSCSGGQGSAGWVTAKHCLVGLGGQSSVKFRFLFGAGTACNNYDGIAIDDVFIGAAPPNSASFTYTCSGNQVTFTNTSAQCPTAYAWDFGDPASGAQNTATTANAAHTYPGPGTYTVTFTTSGPCNAPATVTTPITILDVSINAVDPQCTASSGSCTAVVANYGPPFTYAWSPGGQSTASITGLVAGTYDVTVTAPGACAGTATATLTAPASPLVLTPNASPVTCAGASDGEVSVTVAGGSAPFSYAWSPGGGNASTLTGLAVGTYTVTVTDAAGCSADTNAVVNGPQPLVVTAMADASVCNGASITLTATTSGGTGAATLAWSPAGPVVAPAATTTYTVIATDANGCTSAPDDVAITVGSAVVPVITTGPPAGCATWCVDLATTTPGVQFDWAFGDGATGQGTNVTHCYADAGLFDVSLTVTDAAGCSGVSELADVIEVYAVPAATYVQSPAVALVSDPTFTFTASGAADATYAWSFGDPTGATVTGQGAAFTYAGAGCYPVSLQVTSADGCVNSTEGEACVEDEFALYVPNTFSPNGDGINDAFGVVTSVRAPKDFVLRVFDRWGQELWTGRELNAGWSGDAVPQGVYAWTLELRDATGTQRRARGHVVLLR